VTTKEDRPLLRIVYQKGDIWSVNKLINDKKKILGIHEQHDRIHDQQAQTAAKDVLIKQQSVAPSFADHA
jgi:heterodisulfide reductase subunit C